MPSGKVKWFNAKKGYGFIIDNETQKDIFLHVSELENSKLRVLKEDQTIVYDVKDNNIEQAIRVLKRRLQKDGFFKIMKMKSTYEKPSEKKKRVQTENLKRIKKLQKLKNRY